MPATLEIEKETAEMLAAQAEARGVSVDAYLRPLLKDKSASEEKAPLNTQDRAKLWREWVDNHSIRVEPLSDYALTREGIYAESGMTEDELDTILEEAREEAFQERQGKNDGE